MKTLFSLASISNISNIIFHETPKGERELSNNQVVLPPDEINIIKKASVSGVFKEEEEQLSEIMMIPEKSGFVEIKNINNSLNFLQKQETLNSIKDLHINLKNLQNINTSDLNNLEALAQEKDINIILSVSNQQIPFNVIVDFYNDPLSTFTTSAENNYQNIKGKEKMLEKEINDAINDGRKDYAKRAFSKLTLVQMAKVSGLLTNEILKSSNPLRALKEVTENHKGISQMIESSMRNLAERQKDYTDKANINQYQKNNYSPLNQTKNTAYVRNTPKPSKISPEINISKK